ncbi:MAG: hypothetical protein LUD68_07905 [Rikenellaceae bacterium]|nr:hypothetical protein [Rikenellaceae bacterium]
MVQAIPSGEVGITDKEGKYGFSAIGVQDHILMYLPRQGETTVPVHGLDSLVVVIRSRQLEYIDPYQQQQIDIGYGTVHNSAKTIPVTGLNVPEMVAQSGAKDLFGLLRGRVAGLDISSTGAATIRGGRIL